MHHKLQRSTAVRQDSRVTASHRWETCTKTLGAFTKEQHLAARPDISASILSSLSPSAALAGASYWKREATVPQKGASHQSGKYVGDDGCFRAKRLSLRC